MIFQNLMALMARLAKRNVGRVDWEPHMAVMFTRIMRSLKLPVLYKSAVAPRSSYSESLDIQHSSLWIIACLVNREFSSSISLPI